MAEIIKTYSQQVPALRFIGKKYGDDDRVNGSFGAKWGEWFQNGWFEVIERLHEGSSSEIYEDGDAYIGLMRAKDGEPFEYWIGMLMPEGTAVPEGFGFVDFPESTLGVCWVYGSDATGDIYCHEDECAAKLTEAGLEIQNDKDGACWIFERYGCPRFTTPDEKGNVILDICFFVK